MTIDSSCNGSCKGTTTVKSKTLQTKKRDIVNLVEIDKLREQFGVALIVLKSRDVTNKDAITELMSEDETSLIVRGLALIIAKPHYNDIVTLTGEINPLFTVPDDYLDSKLELIFLDKSDNEKIIEKKNVLGYQIVTDSALIQQFVKGRK